MFTTFMLRPSAFAPRRKPAGRGIALCSKNFNSFASSGELPRRKQKYEGRRLPARSSGTHAKVYGLERGPFYGGIVGGYGMPCTFQKSRRGVPGDAVKQNPDRLGIEEALEGYSMMIAEICTSGDLGGRY